MAVVFQNRDDDKKDDESGGNTLGTESAVINPTDQGPAGGADSQSGQYTNLQSYLDANKGNPLAKTVADKIEGEAGEANQTQEEAGRVFKSQVDSQAVRPDQALLDKVAQDPTAVVQNETDKAAFTKARDAQYSGPQTLADDMAEYAKAQQKQQVANESGAATQSEAGRTALLGKYYSDPSYTAGQKKLDQLLLQNDEGANDAFGRAKSAVDNSATSFNSLKNSLNNYASQAATDTSTARTKARSLLGIDDTGMVQQGQGLLGGLQSNLDQRDQALTEQLRKQRELIESSAGVGNEDQLTPEQRALFGLNQIQGVNLGAGNPDKYYLDNAKTKFNYTPYAGMNVDAGSLYGVNPADYTSLPNETDLTRYSVASNDEAARLAALDQLAGYSEDITGAGKYASGLPTTRSQELNAEIAKRQAGFQQEAQAYKDLMAKRGNRDLIDPTNDLNAIDAIRQKYGLGKTGSGLLRNTNIGRRT